ncbi:MAG: hypothetical protein DRI46_12440 [Chloroflexi bacterium]|nr:MAG: hypothetical protein DRI46_12440 [Chloroflexota bacterium]
MHNGAINNRSSGRGARIGTINAADTLTSEDIKDKNHYIGIPVPLETIEALFNTVSALKQVVEVLSRERGLTGDSAFRVSEAERVISGLRFDIKQLQDTKQDKP